MNEPLLSEPRIAGVIYGAIGGRRVFRSSADQRDYLAAPRFSIETVEDIDVTDLMAAIGGAGHARRHVGGIWELTAAGEERLSEYAVEALFHPEVLRLREQAVAVEDALRRLALFQEPTANQLAVVPPEHRVYLMGQAAGHRAMQELYRRHRRVGEMLASWLGRFGSAGGDPQVRQVALVKAYLDGEAVEHQDGPERVAEMARMVSTGS
jgi:hypothetical protein